MRSVAFGCHDAGIVVDTHVHRVARLLHWVRPLGSTSKQVSGAFLRAKEPESRAENPEQTRVALEEWVPADQRKHFSLNVIGFGQLSRVAGWQKAFLTSIERAHGTTSATMVTAIGIVQKMSDAHHESNGESAENVAKNKLIAADMEVPSYGPVEDSMVGPRDEDVLPQSDADKHTLGHVEHEVIAASEPGCSSASASQGKPPRAQTSSAAPYQLSWKEVREAHVSKLSLSKKRKKAHHPDAVDTASKLSTEPIKEEPSGARASTSAAASVANSASSACPAIREKKTSASIPNTHSHSSSRCIHNELADWVCETCTFLNKNLRARVCIMCGYER